MTSIYQLHARGPGQVLDGERKIVSKRVFLSEDDAKKFIPEFEKLCTDLTSTVIDSIDPKHINIQVIKLELAKNNLMARLLPPEDTEMECTECGHKELQSSVYRIVCPKHMAEVWFGCRNCMRIGTMKFII